MKTKIITLFLTGLTFLFTNCSDDDAELKNYYTYDGTTYAITETSIDMVNLGNENYSIKFFGQKNDQNSFVTVQLSGERDGQEVDLSKTDRNYDWSWYLAYEQGSSTYVYGEGWNLDGDIKSGTLYIKLLDRSTKKFDVKLDATTHDGKNLKLQYNGIVKGDR